MEQAADEGFDCVSCQPYVVKPVGECRRAWKKPRGRVSLALGQCPKLPVVCPSHSASCPTGVGTREGKRAR